jgi:hypothetical protein
VEIKLSFEKHLETQTNTKRITIATHPALEPRNSKIQKAKTITRNASYEMYVALSAQLKQQSVQASTMFGF